MKKFKRWGCGLLAAVLVTAITNAGSFNIMADQAGNVQEGTVRNGWIDENLGPGVARWVDENGNISDQPGVSEEGGSGTSDQHNGTGQGEGDQQAGNSQEAGENQQTGTGQNPEGGQQTESSQDTGSGQAGAGQEAAERQQPAEGQTGENQAADQNQATGRQIDPNKPMVALTFDDGPYAPVGNQIMDSLAQYGGKATFFVVGDRAASYKTELQRMVAEGHEIGNHTYNHKYLTKLNAAQIQEQINRCNDAVEAACGVRPTLVRLPGGLKNSTVLANVHYPIIMWSIDTLDWKTRNAGKTISSVVGKVRDGDIVLMHELYSQSGAAAAEIIPKLVEAGYQLVTVSELAQYRGGLGAGTVYSQFYR